MRRVVFVVFEGFQAVDLVGPHAVFHYAQEAVGGYDCRVVAPRAGLVRSSSGLPMGAEYGIDGLEPEGVDTLVVIGGPGVVEARGDGELVAWIGAAAAGARRVASVCSGALLLASTGVLAGRRVTTHWRKERQLAADHPELTVDCDPIFIRDGHVWTSAGVSAGMDLALALVEDDHGPELALAAAREMVLYLRRPGNQSQFSVPLWSAQPTSDPIRKAVRAIQDDPGARHTVAALAACAGLSPRHLQRRFTAEIGTGPAAYVERVRVEAARRALTEADEPVAALARRLGFGTAETLRRTFHRRIGIAPAEYRDRFGSVR
ncbi:GlxA family transcriptional regulator [Streptomyces sp. NRRL WC-3742]|uniref:GlxA family transcriptional regulator n=1 Tax=Streptomyces sp. NRRL WC-3742 TaxID=1463934 RepID=UPI0004C608F8|nr:DJ-1/PfpI family protein [Streptomyces sp. NRRL WC-3742]